MTNDNYFLYREKLAGVAAEDVRFLLEKDQHYNGSWKRSGGRNAWFMCKRMIDRLIVMMTPPEPPAGWPDSLQVNPETVDRMRRMLISEDIFARVAARPGGEDGTVLAVVRDLRRYLALVEAEMVARGAVDVPPAAEPSPDSTRPSRPDYSVVRMMKEHEGKMLRDFSPQREVERQEFEAGTPEDGGHHTRQGDGYSRQTARDLLNRQARINRQHDLEEESGGSGSRPRMEDGFTTPPSWRTVAVTDPKTDITYFNVDRDHYSDGAIDSLPALRRVINHYEYMALPGCYRGMYDKSGDDSKIGVTLKETYWRHWGVEN
jgi:hypothetical protein